MKKVIISLVVTTLLAGSGAFHLFTMMPRSVPTAVIAEKATNGKVGSGVATTIPDDLTQEQYELLQKAYKIAKADGHKNPEVVQAVLLQETLAGGMKSFRVVNPGPDAYFGLMQVKLSAAKDVLSKWPDLFTKFNIHTKTDDEIKANLILNDVFNVEIASKYLKILQDTYGFSGRDLLNAYNRGPGGVKYVSNDYHYAVGAERKLRAYKASL